MRSFFLNLLLARETKPLILTPRASYFHNNNVISKTTKEISQVLWACLSFTLRPCFCFCCMFLPLRCLLYSKNQWSKQQQSLYAPSHTAMITRPHQTNMLSQALTKHNTNHADSNTGNSALTCERVGLSRLLRISPGVTYRSIRLSVWK